MKLLKLTFVFALLFSAQAAQAVGPMSRAEIRDGQLICLDNLVKNAGAQEAPASQNANADVRSAK